MIDKRINVAGIEGWEAQKSLAINIVNSLCRYPHGNEDIHTPDCFKHLSSVQERKALEELTSPEKMAYSDSHYLVRVVEPLVRSLPSHNGAEPSSLYSLLQRVVRESTDLEEKRVKETKQSIADNAELIESLSKKIGLSGLKTVGDIDLAIKKMKEVKSVLVKQPESFINDIQTQLGRNNCLPGLNEPDKKLSKVEAQDLIRSNGLRLDGETIQSSATLFSLNESVNIAELNLEREKEKNDKAHEVVKNLSKLMGEMPVSYVLPLSASTPKKVDRFRFFNRITNITVTPDDDRKNFVWKGKKSLCDNMIFLLDQYINSSGHSSDRMASAKKIFEGAMNLKVNNKLSPLEQDRALLDLIRKENISSKGRWNGKESKLFSIYREAEFSYREQLMFEHDKVLSGELDTKKEIVQKMKELESVLTDLQAQNVLMDTSIGKLKELREDELLLVMNAEQGKRTEKEQLEHSRIQREHSRKLEKISINDQRIVESQTELLHQTIEAKKLSFDSDKVIADIKALYSKVRDISIRLNSQGKVSLEILPESDTLGESEMVKRATDYLNALKAHAEQKSQEHSAEVIAEINVEGLSLAAN